MTLREDREVQRFVHAVEHLRAAKGIGPFTNEVWFAECWFPFTVSEEARAAYEAGLSATHWCPKLTPSLWGEDG